VAAVNAGKHHSGLSDVEQYGKHSSANAGGLSVATLLERASRAGQAIRLAWRGAEQEGLAQGRDEFPTGVLPVTRSTDDDQTAPDGSPGDDDETEPTTAIRDARRWLRPPGFSWLPQSLAG
jgi:hypothetical protein